MNYNISESESQVQKNSHEDYWTHYAESNNVSPDDLKLYPARRYGNARTVTYPDGSQLVQLSDKPIFRVSSCPPADDTTEITDDYIISGRAEDPAQRAIRRARAKIRDICWCTSFSWFVTFTLDKSKIDRYNWDDVLDKLQHWLNWRVRKYNLAYLIVPEHHKDGAYHLHGVINGALDKYMIDAHRCDRNGHALYNLDAWQYGFTSAAKITGTYHAAIGYVCKYITKEQTKIGGRWYYSGGNLYDLGKPVVDVYHIKCNPQNAFQTEKYSRICDLADLGAKYASTEYHPSSMPQTPAERKITPDTIPEIETYIDAQQMTLFAPVHPY